jgi:deazaflavin-dependent oxidoreductase (nitroreductase family)
MSTNPAMIPMGLQDPSALVGQLTTLGRRTGLSRTVEINLIYLDGKFYATTASVKHKAWCQNMIKNPAVEVQVDERRLRCRSYLVTDEKLRIQVLQLRDSPPLLGRAVFEMSLVRE